mgnify:CR=1 FL=1
MIGRARLRPIAFVEPGHEDRTVGIQCELQLPDWSTRVARGTKGQYDIAIHGLTRNSADFGAIAPLIAQSGRRVLAIDVRGRGTPAVEEALHTASAGDVLEALTGGLDAPVAERGRSFSGGQRQRLVLADGDVREPAWGPYRERR